MNRSSVERPSQRLMWLSSLGSCVGKEAKAPHSFVNFLEPGYPVVDSEVQNLIALSFLENLPNSRQRFGP